VLRKINIQTMIIDHGTTMGRVRSKTDVLYSENCIVSAITKPQSNQTMPLSVKDTLIHCEPYRGFFVTLARRRPNMNKESSVCYCNLSEYYFSQLISDERNSSGSLSTQILEHIDSLWWSHKEDIQCKQRRLSDVNASYLACWFQHCSP